MITEAITGGLLLGAFSSLHCIGMCGPLALSLPVQHLPPWQHRFAVLMYHTGRILTYTLCGLLFSFAGRGLQLNGLQQWLSVGSGIVLLFFILHYYVLKQTWQPAWFSKLNQLLQQVMIRLLHTDKKEIFLLLGMLNGLLPCGMVYVALAAALNFESIQAGTLFMTAFGTGTLPLLMLLSVVGRQLSFSVRLTMKRWIPMMMTAVALLLILRGLNLGIPFISPVMAGAAATAVPCH